ncbi:MAG: GYD domain-containing protein [Chloroflexi bacterium]|nr:GYD domain-containing protein [Chloroflexota bacterium]
MTTFILLTKVSSEGARQVRSLAEMDRRFSDELGRSCPEVKRVASYALLGAYDFLHIFEAPDAHSAAKVALIANTFGVTTTQTLTAIPFSEFDAIVSQI